MSNRRRSRAIPAVAEEQPQTGGAYIRMPDGTLVREEPEAAPPPVDAPVTGNTDPAAKQPGDENTDPAAESAVTKEQEA